ncbi:hypothetical protein TB2_011681 [Malus domestica]
MRLEFYVSIPEMVISLFKTIFFGRDDPLLFIPAEDLDLLLRVALENVEFDQKALSEIFESLCKDRHESPSYSSVMESKADAFSQLLEQHRNDQLAKRPPMVNKKMNPTTNNMGVMYCIEPPLPHGSDPTKDFYSNGDGYDHGSCGKVGTGINV